MKLRYLTPVAAMVFGLAFGGSAIAADAPAMTTDEISSLLVGRTLFMVDRSRGRGAGNSVRMYFSPDGTVSASSSSGMSNSGSYTIKDNTMCNDWRDSRWRSPWCFTLHRDDDDVDFMAITGSPDTGLTWKMRSSKDGNQM